MARVPLVDRALTTLDDVTVARVRPALAWLHEQTPGIGGGPRRRGPAAVPVARAAGGLAGRRTTSSTRSPGRSASCSSRPGSAEQAALCRAAVTHEILSVWRWTRSFPDVPAAFWTPGAVPARPAPGAAGQGRAVPGQRAGAAGGGGRRDRADRRGSPAAPPRCSRSTTGSGGPRSSRGCDPARSGTSRRCGSCTSTSRPRGCWPATGPGSR